MGPAAPAVGHLGCSIREIPRATGIARDLRHRAPGPIGEAHHDRSTPMGRARRDPLWRPPRLAVAVVEPQEPVGDRQADRGRHEEGAAEGDARSGGGGLRHQAVAQGGGRLATIPPRASGSATRRHPSRRLAAVAARLLRMRPCLLLEAYGEIAPTHRPHGEEPERSEGVSNHGHERLLRISREGDRAGMATTAGWR